MATFSYTVLEPSGQRKTGFLDAANREAATQMLSVGGAFVVDLAERSAKAGFGRASADEKKTGGKPSRADLALFTRRLSDLSNAGLPLDRVLQVIAEQSENQQLADVAEASLEDVRSGMSVSQALAKHPNVFPQVFTSTLAAGEASGQLPQVAGRLAAFQEIEVARRSQVVSAMIYPAILLVVAVTVVIFILTFVIPKLTGVFDKMGGELPAATKVLVAAANFFSNQWYIALGSVVGAVFLYKLWVKTESGAATRDAIMLRLPVAGKVILKATVSRFARVLGTLVYGGVPILEALDLAGLASGNKVFQRSALEVKDAVREGRGIAESMRDTGAFPPVLTHMVAVGEETGDIPTMLNRVSDSLDFEVENGLRRVTSMVEPIIVILMGGFVGFVVLAVLLPILGAQDLVK